MDELLIAIVADPMEEVGIALRKDGRRQFAGSLRRQNQAQTELPAFARDLLEYLATDGGGVLVFRIVPVALTKVCASSMTSTVGKVLALAHLAVALQRLQRHACDYRGDDVHDSAGTNERSMIVIEPLEALLSPI